MHAKISCALKHGEKQACEVGWVDLLLAAAHLFRLRVLKLLNECAEKSGSPERLLMFDLPMQHMDEFISLLCGKRNTKFLRKDPAATSKTTLKSAWCHINSNCVPPVGYLQHLEARKHVHSHSLYLLKTIISVILNECKTFSRGTT